MSTTAIQPTTPQRTKATPPSSASARNSVSAGRPSSSRVKSAGKGGAKDGKKAGQIEDGKKEDTASGPLTWSFLTQEDVTVLSEIKEPEDLVRKFADILGMEKTYKEDLMNAILVSFHVGNYLFARDNAFAEVEVATFCAIMKNVLERCVEKALSLDTAIIQFRELLLTHSGAASASGSDAWDIFKPNTAIQITDYVVTSFFQHYRLYQHVFTTEQESETVDVQLHLEEPPIPSSTKSMPILTSTPYPQPTHHTSLPLLSSRSQSQSDNLTTDTTPPKSRTQSRTQSRKSLAIPESLWPPPLQTSLSLETWEEQRRQAEIEAEVARMEAERVAEEERKAAQNPFEILEPEMIKSVATEVVTEMLSGIVAEVERGLEEVRVRFLERVGSR